jgi:antitoxin component YwqK of YwqJK toxin-antitoxin module
MDSEITRINTKVEYYQNGKVKSIGNTDDYTKQFRIGYWNEFHENGKLKESGNYKLDTYKNCCVSGLCNSIYSYKIGEWEYYHQNGKLRAKGTYKIEKKNISTSCENGAKINFG